MRIVKLTAESKKGLLEDLLQRSPNHYGQYESAVAEIIETVKKGGDEALFSYTEKFDHCKMDAAHIRVTREEIDEAYQKVDADFVEVMKKSAANIRAFHEKQLRNSWFDPKPDGTILGMKILPIAIAGVYVPGGKAAYPSSVLMNVLPAKVAGVERIIMTTPPGADGRVNPGTLVAAHIAGVDSVTKAQRRAIGVPLDGALACPPLLFAVNFTSAFPFSKTPTIAKFPGIPPTGSVMIAPPSSHRKNSRIPLRCSSFTSFGAPSPAHSSVQEDARYTSVGGTKPSASSSSTASRKAITVHFVSAVPRPHTLPSAISPEKGA